MNTREKIKNIATKHFARFGYEGASLSQIASDVGIKKASLYAHYSSKLALFEYCMDSAQSEFMESTKKILNHEKYDTAEKQIYGVLNDYITTKTDKEFYIRFAFMPPENIDERGKYPNNFIEIMSDLMDEPISSFLKEQGIIDESQINNKDNAHTIEIIKETKEAYLCMLDGLMVEFIFGDNASYNSRLKAAWSVFMKGVK